jgi:hypothetical protein
VPGNVDATIEYLPAGMTWQYTISSLRTDFYQHYQITGIVAQYIFSDHDIGLRKGFYPDQDVIAHP